jgi:hypothetical protein
LNNGNNEVYDPKAAAGGTINQLKKSDTREYYRYVQGVTFKGQIGTATNRIYDVNGYEKKKTL